MAGPLRITTHAPDETEAVGRALAAALPEGAVVALYGGLATGKTCLVRGMARHFAPDAPVHSPTFTLVNEYGRAPRLYHLDLYRLSGPEELADLGYEELFEPDGVCVIEWAERAGALLPEDCLRIALEHAGADARRIEIAAHDALLAGWADALGAVSEEP